MTSEQRDQLTFDDPTTRHPDITPPEQDQPKPGLDAELEPRSDRGETSYRGTGRLEGRKALVTGGDSGIGGAVAIAFAREGADVAINYLPDEEEDAARIAELVEANPRWHECDVWWKIEALQQVRRSAVEGFFRDNAAINVIERLRAIDVPTQILVADPDFGSIWRVEHLALVKGLVPSSVGVEVIEGSSHNMHRDTFAPFSMALGVFVRGGVSGVFSPTTAA